MNNKHFTRETRYHFFQKKSTINYYSFLLHSLLSFRSPKEKKLMLWENLFKFIERRKKKTLDFNPPLTLLKTKKPLHQLEQPARVIFLVFSRFMFKNINFFFKSHSKFKSFFNLTSRVGLLQIDFKVYFHRWLNGNLLLINIFYFNLTLLILGNKFLWKETLTLNWLRYDFSTTLFSILRNKFFFKDHNPNIKTDVIFDKLKALNPDAFLVVNSSSHKTNLFFLRKSGIFTLGFTSIDTNPWLLSYPIPVFNQNLVVQYFLFQLLLFSFLKAKSIRFNSLYDFWCKLN